MAFDKMSAATSSWKSVGVITVNSAHSMVGYEVGALLGAAEGDKVVNIGSVVGLNVVGDCVVLTMGASVGLIVGHSVNIPVIYKRRLSSNSISSPPSRLLRVVDTLKYAHSSSGGFLP